MQSSNNNGTTTAGASGGVDQANDECELLTATTACPPKDLKLEGQHILLRGLQVEEDFAELYENSHGEKNKEIFKWLSFGGATLDGFPNIQAFKSHLQTMATGTLWVPMVVIDKASGRKIGMCNYLNIVPLHRTIEIGGIWYTPDFHRTYANTESCFLLIEYAFEVLKYRRVEWKTDSHNDKSKTSCVATRLYFRRNFQATHDKQGAQQGHCLVITFGLRVVQGKTCLGQENGNVQQITKL